MKRTRIFVTGLRVSMIIGIYPEERVTPQDLVLDLNVTLVAHDFDANDHIDQTVDYAEVVRRIREFSASRSDELLEIYGAALCDTLMLDTRIADLRLTIHKPLAAKYLGVDDVGVCVERARSND